MPQARINVLHDVVNDKMEYDRVCMYVCMCLCGMKQRRQGEAMSTDSWLNEPLGQPLGLGTMPPAGLARDRHLLALGRPSKQRKVGIYVRGNTPQCRRHVTVSCKMLSITNGICLWVCAYICIHVKYEGEAARRSDEHRQLAQRAVGTNPRASGRSAAHTMKTIPPDATYAPQQGQGINGPAFFCRLAAESWARRHCS